jgi:hypothetical protein
MPPLSIPCAPQVVRLVQSFRQMYGLMPGDSGRRRDASKSPVPGPSPPPWQAWEPLLLLIDGVYAQIRASAGAQRRHGDNATRAAGQHSKGSAQAAAPYAAVLQAARIAWLKKQLNDLAAAGGGGGGLRSPPGRPAPRASTSPYLQVGGAAGWQAQLWRSLRVRCSHKPNTTHRLFATSCCFVIVHV